VAALAEVDGSGLADELRAKRRAQEEEDHQAACVPMSEDLFNVRIP